MGRVVVDVMPKPEILDPQGKAVAGALPRLGFGRFTSVRQGKRFELELDGDVTEERLEEVRRAAEMLLANTVIETFNVRVEAPPESPEEESPDEETPDEESPDDESLAKDDEAKPAEPADEAEFATQAG